MHLRLAGASLPERGAALKIVAGIGFYRVPGWTAQDLPRRKDAEGVASFRMICRHDLSLAIGNSTSLGCRLP